MPLSECWTVEWLVRNNETQRGESRDFFCWSLITQPRERDWLIKWYRVWQNDRTSVQYFGWNPDFKEAIIRFGFTPMIRVLRSQEHKWLIKIWVYIKLKKNGCILNIKKIKIGNLDFKLHSICTSVIPRYVKRKKRPLVHFPYNDEKNETPTRIIIFRILKNYWYQSGSSTAFVFVLLRVLHPEKRKKWSPQFLLYFSYIILLHFAVCFHFVVVVWAFKPLPRLERCVRPWLISVHPRCFFFAHTGPGCFLPSCDEVARHRPGLVSRLQTDGGDPHPREHPPSISPNMSTRMQHNILQTSPRHKRPGYGIKGEWLIYVDILVNKITRRWFCLKGAAGWRSVPPIPESEPPVCMRV
jgi:hypothetical protein